ncbi:MAG: HAMP domain-containing protein [Planctomycetaceae bacterium]|jgi:signal transduction histidine kinase|nr:HAMP domain-containing protein [Planctomycetaceae bacterium]
MIRNKFLASLGILILLVSVLAGAELYAVYLYQKQVRDVAWRVNVLPLAHKIAGQVSELQVSLGELRGILHTRLRISPLYAGGYHTVLESQFQKTLFGLKQSGQKYQQVLDDRIAQSGIKDSFAQERETLQNIRFTAAALETSVSQTDWSSSDSGIDAAESCLLNLQKYTDTLPVLLNDELQGYSRTIQRHAVWLKGSAIFYVTISVTLMFFLVHLSYRWIFNPLQTIVNGSRHVAAGRFDYRISVNAKGEIAELAEAMNLMTQRFQEKVEQIEESKSDLDEKIKQRSKELVRSERLASVGFLAAGVAHEINNPLMVISGAAELLQRRINDDVEQNSGTDTVFAEKYLKMIQDEAFRCKKITEQLLSIARNETKEKVPTNIVTIITDMAELVRQQSVFKQKNVKLNLPEHLEVKVHPQEIKQVILNLLTNAFQSTEADGMVTVRLEEKESAVVLTFQDDGFGMESDVLQNIFEPFYTHRRQGSGTGLGLSITHRIIEEHGGRIEAFSGGTNQGATFVVELPRC